MDKLTTIGIDLAKDVIAVCVMDHHGAVTELRAFRREAFEHWAELKELLDRLAQLSKAAGMQKILAKQAA
jgi:hypothetical protein